MASSGHDDPTPPHGVAWLPKTLPAEELLEDIDAPALLLDVSGHVVFANACATRLFGKELAGQTLASLVAKQRQLTDLLYAQAYTDALTGLANRRSLAEVESKVAGSPPADWQRCGVIFVDIDRFAEFNVLYGFQAGDQALKQVAAALKRAGRDHDQAYRASGEQFVMVLPGAEPETVDQVARQVLDGIHDLCIPHAKGPTGSLSALVIGTSLMPGESVGAAIVRTGDLSASCKARGVRAQVVTAP